MAPLACKQQPIAAQTLQPCRALRGRTGGLLRRMATHPSGRGAAAAIARRSGPAATLPSLKQQGGSRPPGLVESGPSQPICGQKRKKKKTVWLPVTGPECRDLVVRKVPLHNGVGPPPGPRPPPHRLNLTSRGRTGRAARRPACVPPLSVRLLPHPQLTSNRQVNSNRAPRSAGMPSQVGRIIISD